MTLTVGADPEFFLRHKSTNDLVSAHDKVPGTKKHPHKMKYGSCQADGIAVEINIDPAKTLEEFNDNVTSTLMCVRELIDRDYFFDFTPAVSFHEGFLAPLPNYAKELGCDPDYNILLGRPNPIPRDPNNMRTGSGHFHIGWCPKPGVPEHIHMADCLLFVREFEFHHEKMYQTYEDEKRRRLYGSYGSCRIKSYGVEIRSPSNRWLADKRLTELYWAIIRDTWLKLTSQDRTIDPWLWNLANITIDMEYRKGKSPYLQQDE